MSKPTLTDQMDKWAANLDARFKRANLGGDCWNCGCPDVQYVRTLSEEDARTMLAEPRWPSGPEVAERLQQELKNIGTHVPLYEVEHLLAALQEKP